MQQDERSDPLLIAAISRGDELAFATLYDRYRIKVFQVALSRLRDPQLAEEVVDDVFMRCWEQAATFKSDAVSAKSWLCRITEHRAIDLWRSKQGQQRAREYALLDQEPAATDNGDGGFAAEVALRLTVQQAIDRLSEPQQQVLRLAYYGGLSQTEIAAVIDVPLGTVKTRTRAALEALRQSLGAAAAALASGEGG